MLEATLVDVAAEHITPLLDGLRCKRINVEGCDVFVIRVPDTRSKPRGCRWIGSQKRDQHWVRFPTRMEDHTTFMTVGDVHQAVLEAPMRRDIQDMKTQLQTKELKAEDVLQCGDPDRVARYFEALFRVRLKASPQLRAIRMTAMPLPLLTRAPLGDRDTEVRDAISSIAMHDYRGWGINAPADPRDEEYGLIVEDRRKACMLILARNGFAEFSASVETQDFLMSSGGRRSELIYVLEPQAVIGYSKAFVSFVRDYSTYLPSVDRFRFIVAFWNCSGLKLCASPPGSLERLDINASHFDHTRLRGNRVVCRSVEVSCGAIEDAERQLVEHVFKAFRYDPATVERFLEDGKFA